MSMRIEAERNGAQRYDLNVQTPTGPYRERRNFPEALKTASARERWLRARELHLTGKGPEKQVIPCPSLRVFGERWMEEYSRANGNKPSTIAAKETILRLHLYPVLGMVPLDGIGDLAVQRLKLYLQDYAPKTRACVLSVLSTLLRTAERWEEIVKAPHIDLPQIPDPGMAFYDFEEWEALVDGARRAGPMVLCAVLLGGEAGLRRGELVALERADIGRVSVRVVRNEWEGHTGSPKGGKARTIPLTGRLAAALQPVRLGRGKRLLWQANGRPVGVETLKSWMEVACKRAGLPPSKNLHRLRHSFCSHLAMRGAPAKTIQELAGHADLATTMRYMHLSRGSKEAAIALLEPSKPLGNSVEQSAQKGRG